jgi:hypothetical protein
MKRVIGAAAVALVLTASASAYPKPSARFLAKPFTGTPLPSAWAGRWREAHTSNSGVLWHFFAKGSAACEALVAGRTSCFTLTPPGADWFDGGAITLDRTNAVFRMTYRGRPGTVGCFADDAYPFHASSTVILILAGNAHSCFWQTGVERFPVHLERSDQQP